MTDKSGAMHVDAALVRQLAELLDETRLTEIEVHDGERKIRVARKAAQVVASMPTAMQSAPTSVATAIAPSAVVVQDTTNAMRSPMVGTAYLLPEPGAKPFVNVGDTVTEGQTVLIIEAMKVMNPIAAPRSGKVSAILIENSAPVEYDQPLIVID